MEEKILSPLIVKPAQKGRLAKPVLVIAVTDGTPQGEPREKILRVIMQANKDLSRTRYGADALSISFAQVGNDTRAQAFLGEFPSVSKSQADADCEGFGLQVKSTITPLSVV